MKKILTTLLLTSCIVTSAQADDLQKGLNVIVTSAAPQTQMMAMVLSMKTMTTHKKAVHMVLCDKAGDLAVKDSESPALKPIDVSPKDMMKKLIANGMDVKLCPLYLPNLGKDESILIDGVEIADPDKVSENLLNEDYNTLSY